MVDVKNLKSLKKDLKNFKKIVKKDQVQGKAKAIEIKIKCLDLLKDKSIISNTKSFNELNKIIANLDLYIDNVSRMEDIKEKWG